MKNTQDKQKEISKILRKKIPLSQRLNKIKLLLKVK